MHFIRPMKDIIAKEVALYNYFNHIEYQTRFSVISKLKRNSSIGRLTESFIVGLVKDFPSTVSTVVQTSMKLLKPDNILSNSKCIICQWYD